MRYFIKQHIHSCFASWSSEDVTLVKETAKEEFEALIADDKESLISEKYGFSIVYLKSDDKYGKVEHFRERISKETLRNYIWETYLEKGWHLTDTFLDAALSQHWKDEDDKRTQERTEQGYVIPKWSSELPPEAYQGGFSDEVFFNPELFDYLKGGGCHGFVGHSVRKAELDRYFEQAFLAANPDRSLLAMWLTSTGGRHFGDSLECSTFEEQKVYIASQIGSVIQQALSYVKKEKGAGTK